MIDFFPTLSIEVSVPSKVQRQFVLMHVLKLVVLGGGKHVVGQVDAFGATARGFLGCS